MTEPAPTMRAEVLGEWLKRLRSGEYTQGRESLKSLGRHCCLGVLCEIAVDQDYGAWTTEGACYSYESPDKDEGARDDIPPDSLLAWAGVQRYDRPLKAQPPDECDSVPLHDLNDGTGHHSRTYTFAEIADLIEAQFTPIP